MSLLLALAGAQVRLSWLEIAPADATVNVRLSWLEIEPGDAVEPPIDIGNDSRGLGIGGPHAGRDRARRIQAMRDAAVRARNQEIIQAIVAMVTSGALDDVTVE